MSFQKFRKACEKIAGNHGNLLEMPPKEISADLALPCFLLAKEMKKSPAAISMELAGKWKASGLVKTVKAEGPYVNFYADWDKLANSIVKDALKHDYGKGNSGKKIMIEYSGPNTNKPLHVGHLRNDSIGMALSNTLQFAGNEVIRTNIINDRGVHICKSMIAYKKWGSNDTPEKTDKKPDHFVGDYYVMFEQKAKEDAALKDEIQEMLRKWESGDKEVKALWKKMNLWAIAGIKKTYETFGSRFDLWPLESEFYDKAASVLQEGKKKGLFIKNEKGDLIAKLEPELPNKVVLRADGTSIYITNDIALTKHRFENYGIGRCIWIVATEQNLHFQQLFRIFEKLGYKWAKNCYHLGYGLVNLPSGRMKTREGTVVDADALIAELKNLAKDEIGKRDKNVSAKETEERSLAIALAAIKYFMLKVEPQKDILFNPEHAITFDGDSGPYLQYTYARAGSILGKSEKKPKPGIMQEKEIILAKKLSRFPSVVEKASQELKPNIVANYTSELAGLFNTYYHDEKIIGSENEDAKLALVAAVKNVLGIGMYLLGIKPLEKM